MKINLTVNRRYIINGKAYGSLEAMPAEVRVAYERATAAPPDAIPAGVSMEITFNGRTYQHLDAMPEADRRLYELAMKAVATPAVATPESSFSPRWLLLAVLMLGLLIALYYLRDAAGAK